MDTTRTNTNQNDRMEFIEKQIFTQMQIVQIVLDGEGNFCALNAAAETIFERTEAELIGQPFASVLDPFSQEKAILMIEKTLSEGAAYEWELDHIQSGGNPVLLGYTTQVLHNNFGKIIGIGAIGINLTNKLALTAQLSQANQDLEGALLKLEKSHAELKSTQAQLVQSEKMRTLGQLVAGIAHEINNPAAFIANNLIHLAKIVPALVDLFEAYAPLKQYASPEQHQTIEAAEETAELNYLWQDLFDITRESTNGIDRIRNIVLSLRNFSRLDEAEHKYADINEGLRSTLQLIRPACKNRIQIVDEYANLPQIPCLPGELNQVFLNLLTNAVQSISGDGIITIKTQNETDKIIITIQDSGCGMDPSTIQHLGEPFFTTKPIGTGTGLGLSISYGIIQRHRGTLRFESQPNHGTTAIVEIPKQ